MGNLLQSVPYFGDEVLSFGLPEPWYTDLYRGAKTVHLIYGAYREYVDKTGGPVKICQSPSRDHGKYMMLKLKTVRSFSTLAECFDSEEFGWVNIAPQAANSEEAYNICEASMGLTEGKPNIIALVLESYY